eukprot:3935597-Rhodomonas_salina.6
MLLPFSAYRRAMRCPVLILRMLLPARGLCVPGTDLACGAVPVRGGEDCGKGSDSESNLRGSVSCYAFAMRCPVPTSAMLLPGLEGSSGRGGTGGGERSSGCAICLRARYAMPGTDIA